MKKNGFTLIELLAIIVILAIIAVITVPIILNIIDTSKKGAAQDSAYGYKDAIEKYYVSQLSENTDMKLTGEYIVSNGVLNGNGISNVKIPIEGITPTSGILEYQDNKLKSGCLIINEYAVTFVDGSVTNVGNDKCIDDEIEYVFDYTGGEQEFNVPKSGYYKLEVWGAQGGSGDSQGGYGGYSTGLILLNKDEKLYINVGGSGSGNLSSLVSGGYNGGGASSYSSDYPGEKFASGGGATHIAKVSGLLSSLESVKGDYSETAGTYVSEKIFIVAGGGGGAGWGNYGNFLGGSAGGYKGVQSNYYGEYSSGGGATQTSGGSAGIGSSSGSFGQGATSDLEKNSGGGGGFYGGGNGAYANAPGGGGSGYIGNASLNNKVMYCYNCEESTAVNTKTISTVNVSESATSNYAKMGNGYAKITYIGSNLPASTEYVFSYTNSGQEFNVPATGYYRIEAWGAQGESSSGGKGAYTFGLIKLNKDTVLYVFVGGQGNTFNGGGDSNSNSLNKGGGATDIRLVNGNWDDDDSLRSRIMVAAGGGNVTSVVQGATAGVGGKTNGIDGTPFSGVPVEYAGKGANPSSGGAGGTSASAGTFGKGGSAGVYTDGHVGAGGGGGYYGGGGSTWHAGSGGGSSFISGYAGCVCITTGTSECPGYVFINSVMKSGNESMPTHNGGSYMVGNEGNGYAKITYIGPDIPVSTEFIFDYTGNEQEFNAPTTGNYKLEVWGAQGGNASETYHGGYGSYSTGIIKLNNNEKIYINVGGQGKTCYGSSSTSSGGYNGGGDAKCYSQSSSRGSGGGGATHIATGSGILSSLSNSKETILIVAGGGGGGADTNNLNHGVGGSGGGYVGGSATSFASDTIKNGYGYGGNQEEAGCNTWDTGSDTYCGTFGQGFTNEELASGFYNTGGGGGGYYGGGGGRVNASGGGSGYIGNPLLNDKVMYCYNCTESNDNATKTVSTTGTSDLRDTINCSSGYSELSISKCAKIGNGYAKITYLGK